jgi:hypothetical protein
MTPKRSIDRVAAFTGAAAFLFSLAHVSPVAAQATRYAKDCSATFAVGASAADCTIAVPAGKRFVVETITVGGYVPSAQYTKVEVGATVDGLSLKYVVPAGFQVLDNGWSWWGGALTSTVFSDGGLRLWVYRQGSGLSCSLRLTAVGHLEDL